MDVFNAEKQDNFRVRWSLFRIQVSSSYPSRAGNTYTVSKIPKAAQWRVELDKLSKTTMYPNSCLGLNSLLARKPQIFLRLILELSSLGLHLEG